MKPKRERGRPELPPKERKSVLMPIRLTEGERAKIEAASGGKASTWARDVLLRAASRRKK